MSVRVKICGITRAEDALAAAVAGADALGFMFYEKSRRYLSPEAARAIVAELPPFVATVGVFVNADANQVRRCAECSGVDLLQFHGDETPEFCRSFGRRTIKAFRVANAESLERLQRYPDSTWLLDAAVPGQWGGTGERFDWNLAAAASRARKPIILAGGLTVENVAEAVRWAQPYAVDVSSGVESAPGKKDAAKIRAFIVAARSGM